MADNTEADTDTSCVAVDVYTGIEKVAPSTEGDTETEVTIEYVGIENVALKTLGVVSTNRVVVTVEAGRLNVATRGSGEIVT